jgi:hypothetical protein
MQPPSPQEGTKAPSPVFTPAQQEEKKSDKLNKKELERRQKEEERNSKKFKKKEQEDARLSKKFQLPLEVVQNRINSYRCAYHKTGIIHHGKVYVFPHFICFTSSSGLTTAKIAIADIQNIALRVINAIQIVTAPPDVPNGKKYYLSHWHHRERAFKTFNALWRYARGDTTINLEDLKDVNKLKAMSFQDDSKSGLSGSRGTSGSLMDTQNSMEELSSVEDLQCDFELQSSMSTLAMPLAEEETIQMPPVLDKIQYIPPHASRSPDASAVLETGLRQCWQSFFSNSKFYSDVHLARGDPVARTGEWSPSPEGYLVRPHYFEANIKSKLIKGKVVKAEQTQQACLVNDKQFIFGTESRMEGVPFASDFTVKTYWEVSEERPRLVNIQVWLWVDWIKVPFGLKGTIERGSIGGVKEHFEAFISAAKAFLTSGTGPQLPTPTEANSTEPYGNDDGAPPEITQPPDAPTVTRDAPRAPLRQSGGLFKDPTPTIALGVILVVLLVVLTCFFVFNVRSSAPVFDERAEVILTDAKLRILMEQLQTELNTIHTHINEARALTDKLQKSLQSLPEKSPSPD